MKVNPVVADRVVTQSKTGQSATRQVNGRFAGMKGFLEARVTAAQRKKLKPSQFGSPSKAKTSKGRAKSGSFPMHDKAHARAALRFIRHASPADQKRIRAKAAKMGVGKDAEKKGK